MGSLIGGAQPGNVFWQVGSSATLGTSSTFAGSILALTSISVDSGVTLNGRALARNGAVTLINDTINVPTSTPTPTPTPSPAPSPSPPPPVGGGRTGFCVTSHAPIGSTDRRPPERPLLLSPRARARVSPGLVRFSWRPAARAARYTLMVDDRRMNTRCRTNAAMLVSAGRHSYRVIAQNRLGSHSSRDRAFVAAGGAKVHRYSHTYYSGGQEYFRSDDGILDADVTRVSGFSGSEGGAVMAGVVGAGRRGFEFEQAIRAATRIRWATKPSAAGRSQRLVRGLLTGGSPPCFRFPVRFKDCCPCSMVASRSQRCRRSACSSLG